MQKIEKVCSYEKLDSGIYEIILTESSQVATDGWIEALTAINKEPDKHKRILFLTEFRGGMLPLNYAVPKMREFIRQHPNRAPMRTAFLYPKNFLVVTVSVIANAMIARSREEIQFFMLEDRAKALAWLLRD